MSKKTVWKRSCALIGWVESGDMFSSSELNSRIDLMSPLHALQNSSPLYKSKHAPSFIRIDSSISLGVELLADFVGALSLLLLMHYVLYVDYEWFYSLMSNGYWGSIKSTNSLVFNSHQGPHWTVLFLIKRCLIMKPTLLLLRNAFLKVMRGPDCP